VTYYKKITHLGKFNWLVNMYIIEAEPEMNNVVIYYHVWDVSDMREIC